MNNRGTGGNSSQTNLGRGQSLVSTQLLKVATNMRHIDELFLWLAQTLVQNFDAQVVQFWATQSTRTGQYFIQLRTMVRQDTTLPQHVVTNNQVVEVAERILSERRNYLLQPTGNIFLPYQASLLARYGLNYFFSYFLSSNTLLPPPSNEEASGESLPTPLAMTVMLFLRQAPAQNLLSAIRLSSEQALAVAAYRGLLLYPNVSSGRLPAVSNGTPRQVGVAPQQNSLLPLEHLIPRRLEDANFMTTSNPLTFSAAISDKSARRLLAAIDGSKNFDELRISLNMDSKEAYRALQILLDQHRIELYEPGGEPADRSQYFQSP
jgi:hypothetical protein